MLHRDRAKCRFCEFKWCIRYKYWRFLHLNEDLNSDFAPTGEPLSRASPLPHLKCIPNVGAAVRRFDLLANEFNSVHLKTRKKKRSPKAPLFQTTNPNQASFLCRTRCGWAAASPRRFLRSASYSV